MMESTRTKRWIEIAVVVGALYFVIGFVFAVLANPASGQTQFTWRLMAWVASAALFASHIGYERFRFGNSPRVIATHAALAVGFGAFLLAVNATIHSLMVVPSAPLRRFALALIIWPIITGVPAFVVALMMAAVLSLIPNKRLAQ